MKTFFKRSLSLLMAISVFLPASAMAQVRSFDEIIVAADLRSDDVTSFLEEFAIIEHCLNNSLSAIERDLNAATGACMGLQVFSGSNHTLRSAWDTAKDLGVVSSEAKPRATLSNAEYLNILFDLAGVSISPLSLRQITIDMVALDLRLRRDEMTALAKAIENGLILAPETQTEAKLLGAALQSTVTVSQGLAYLYQIATSQHSGPIITITPTDYNPPVVSTPFSNQLELEGVLKEIVRTIKNESLYSDSFDEKAAMEAALKALVQSLSEDKYIQYYSEDEYQAFSDDLNGNLEGIGAYIEEKEGEIIIVSPIQGSPAQEAGLRAADVITHINDVSTAGMTVQEAVELIRGPEGSSVTLTIHRKGNTFDVVIIRKRIDIPELIQESRDGIEIIQLIQFGGRSAAEMKEALLDVKKKNPRGLIIDLRNNPGGFLDQVVEIVDFFIGPDQDVVILEEKNNTSSLISEDEVLISNIPIAVLINHGSASASEILAGALQSYGVADIYGETSFGKGTVQNIISLRDSTQYRDSAFKFTTAEYLVGSPSGQPVKIDGIGVIPDSNPSGQSPLLDDETTERDEALDAVINAMR